MARQFASSLGVRMPPFFACLDFLVHSKLPRRIQEERIHLPFRNRGNSQLLTVAQGRDRCQLGIRRRPVATPSPGRIVEGCSVAALRAEPLRLLRVKLSFSNRLGAMRFVFYVWKSGRKKAWKPPDCGLPADALTCLTMPRLMGCGAVAFAVAAGALIFPFSKF